MAVETKAYPLRIETAIYKQIVKQANAEKRSVNFIINKLLELQLKEEAK